MLQVAGGEWQVAGGDSHSQFTIHHSPFTIHHSLFLTSPTPNSAYTIHPGVPVERQRLPVRGHTSDGPWHSLRLLVDGELLLESRNSSNVEGWWQLAPGQHRFWLEGERDFGAPIQRTEPILIVVE